MCLSVITPVISRFQVFSFFFVRSRPFSSLASTMSLEMTLAAKYSPSFLVRESSVKGGGTSGTLKRKLESHDTSFTRLGVADNPAESTPGAEAFQPIAYGAFLNDIVNFLIVAFAVFMIVKQANRLKTPAPAASR